jgi:hypothetical protein
VKRWAVPILCGLVVLLPAAATAKNVQSATICGASGCHQAMDADVSEALEAGATPALPPAHGAPWYRVRARMGGDGERGALRLAIVPSRRLVRGCCSPGGGYVWRRMTAAGKRAYARLTRLLDPFPASSLRGVAPASAARVAEIDRPRRHDGISAGGIADSGGGAPGGLWIWIALPVIAIVGGIEWRRRSRRAP